MIESNPSNVSSAFEILLEEVKAEIDFVNRLGAKAFEGGDHKKVKEALERARSITEFRDRLAAMRKEWQEMSAGRPADGETPVERRNVGRLDRGMRTPEDAYERPILEVLAGMGGAGRVTEVLERVEKAMKGTLKQVDYEPLTSNPETLRWRNAAQWARNTMVKEGLLKGDSPRGVWEISEAGRRLLDGGK